MSDLAFLTEPAPAYGVAEDVAPGLRRVVAPNPGPMTYHGTNTWLVAAEAGLVVIDPGPDDAAHLDAVLRAAQGQVHRILLTHTHPDHVGAAAGLRAATGARIAGFGRPWAQGLSPDIALGDDDTLCGLTALHTPGHASDHLCFAWERGGLFSGDHVMSWNTSIVSPPDGDMSAYMQNLRRLLGREEAPFYCGHGPVLRQPQALIRAMLGHRVAREGAVASALGAGASRPADIVDRLYADLEPRLKKAAERTVLAHLIKLQNDGRARQEDGVWTAV